MPNLYLELFEYVNVMELASFGVVFLLAKPLGNLMEENVVSRE